MGTRADFYVGRGQDAEWLGSIAFDGYEIDEKRAEALEDSAESRLAHSCSEEAYRLAVAEVLLRDDATTPERGWPWPWSNSQTSDYAYCWDQGKLHVFLFGRAEGQEDGPKEDFPEMSTDRAASGVRSGVIVFSASSPTSKE